MSGTSLPPLTLRVTAKDETGTALDRVRKRVGQTGSAAEQAGKGIAKLGDTSGVTRMAQGFDGLAYSAGTTFRAVSQLAPALSGITGATSLAGMTAMVARWTQLGQAAYLTGQRLGVPTDRLTALRGAARLAGASAEDLDGGLRSLDERLRGATFRTDSTAIQTFNQLGVGFRNGAGGARNAADALGDVADGIQRLYAGGKGRGAALRAAQNLGMESLFPLLIKGRAGIQALSAESARLGGVISPEAAKRADALKSSFAGLEIAVEGVANRLGDQWSQAVKPYIDGTANWIANNKRVADSYAQIGIAIVGLGTNAAVGAAARKLGLSYPSLPIGRSLLWGSVLSLHGDTAPGSPGQMNPDGTWGPNHERPYTGPAETIGQWYRRHAPAWLGGNPAPHASRIGLPQRGTPAWDVMKRTHDFWISKGFTERQVAGILAGGPAAESGFNPDLTGDGGTSYGLYQHHASRRAALFARYGEHPTVEQQNQFAWDELNDPARRGTLAALRAAPTSANAAAVFTSGFEVPADTANTAMARAGAAKQFEGAVDVNVHIHGAPPGTRATASGSGAVSVAPPRVETAMPMH